MYKKLLFSILLFFATFYSITAQISKVWVADNGDGTYKNPILHADYSDPDVCRVGEDYYMTASSFNCVPGLPILHSKDMVNWKHIGYALKKLDYAKGFDKPQHGKGIWAPCIRYHNEEIYIFFPDPDQGIYMTKAKDAVGPWSEPVQVVGGKGLIDPSPLWDDDGKAYLVFAFAGSRAGVKTVLMVAPMNWEGIKLTGSPVMVFDGHDGNTTVEGPKFYKHNDFYYIFAPAGGVKPGWQLVLRSKDVFGPYEEKIVLAQGNTNINGPHQGAWVQTPSGEDWFYHFQDKDAYGRIVHLQPMEWKNDWPVMGTDPDGDGIGEPVLKANMPDVGGKFPVVTPPESDEFNGHTLGLQWQWHANPDMKYGFASGNLGFYRLNCIPKGENHKNLWDVPNLLLQKFPAEEFTAIAKITFNARFDGEEAGFVVMGQDYQYISLKQNEGQLSVKVNQCMDARTGNIEKKVFSQKTEVKTIYFRVKVKKDAICKFSYSEDGKKYFEAGEEFTAKAGRWIGAKKGFFALRDGVINDSGNLDIDWFRIEKL